MGSRFSNGLGYQMLCEPLIEFWETDTHLKVRDSCHVLTFSGRGVTQLVGIVDQRMKELKNKVITMVKVLWRSDRIE